MLNGASSRARAAAAGTQSAALHAAMQQAQQIDGAERITVSDSTDTATSSRQSHELRQMEVA